MAETIVGRAGEVAAITALLSDEQRTPSALLVEGEAGIGKTTLWREGVRAARAKGIRVLLAQPAETEASLPYGALGDLLGDVVDDRASVLADVLAGRADDRLATSRATLELIQHLAGQGMLVIAVDDVQWLDAPSEAILSFVIRRLTDLPVRVIATRRTTESLPPPLDLARAFDERFRRVWLGPMPLGDLDRLLRERLGVRWPQPRLEKLHRAAGGNPFYALEIAGSLPRDDQDVAVPSHLSAVVEARLSALPADARDAILLASACLQPTELLVGHAAGGPGGIAAAIEAGVLQIDRSRLRFTHPLLASVTYDAALPWARREAHARLAAATDVALERAHHLARATTEPDEGVAAELHAAARSARTQGAAMLAAELADDATRLTPAGSEEWAERAMLAARARMTASDPQGASERFQHLIDTLPAGLQRARALAHLSELSPYPAALELGLQGLEEGKDDPSFCGEMHLGIAITLWNQQDVDGYLEHARAAVAVAERIGDERLHAMSLAELRETEVLLALGPFTEDEAEHLLALESRSDWGLSSYLRPSLKVANIYMLTDRLDQARAILLAELRRVEGSGDEAIRWGMLTRLAELELRAGNLASSLSYSTQAVESRLSGGDPHPFALVPHAWTLAHLGDLEAARAAATQALELAERDGRSIFATRARAVLGFIALSAGEPLEALTHLRPVVDGLVRMRYGELSASGVAQNAIEAAVAVGDLDEAERLCDWVADKGRPADRAWHRAIAARGRAMVAAERGDLGEARDWIAQALEAHASVPQPFELGRSLLAHGRIERRAKSRKGAREALEAALDIFDQMGAARFAEIAASELARIPGRAPSSGELTETERRVSELVAKGMSNKQIAAQMFVTVRTVEANLTRIYAKLGIRSRTELAARAGA